MSKRSKSSSRWLQEHHADEYVKRSKVEGWRSRAVYKLQELDQRDRLFKPHMTIVDLGAAPGGWSQYVGRKLGKNARVVASDILLMDELQYVDFIQGDFREQEVADKIEALAPAGTIDVVMSDMAPNMSGSEAVDIPRAMYLCELALAMAVKLLKPDGAFVTKVFQGEGFDEYVKAARVLFKSVKVRKPKASRPRSREVYLVAQGFKG